MKHSSSRCCFRGASLFNCQPLQLPLPQGGSTAALAGGACYYALSSAAASAPSLGSLPGSAPSLGSLPGATSSLQPVVPGPLLPVLDLCNRVQSIRLEGEVGMHGGDEYRKSPSARGCTWTSKPAKPSEPRSHEENFVYRLYRLFFVLIIADYFRVVFL